MGGNAWLGVQLTMGEWLVCIHGDGVPHEHGVPHGDAIAVKAGLGAAVEHMSSESLFAGFIAGVRNTDSVGAR